MKHHTLTLFLLLLAWSGLAQNVGGDTSPELSTELYPKSTYRSPVNHPIKISGTFGELRSNIKGIGLNHT